MTCRREFFGSFCCVFQAQKPADSNTRNIFNDNDCNVCLRVVLSTETNIKDTDIQQIRGIQYLKGLLGNKFTWYPRNREIGQRTFLRILGKLMSNINSRKIPEEPIRRMHFAPPLQFWLIRECMTEISERFPFFILKT